MRLWGPHPILSKAARSGLRRALTLLTALSWAGLASLYGFAGLATLMTGHLPSYGNPDPKALELPAVHLGVFVAIQASVVGVVLWVLWAPFFARALGLKPVLVRFAWLGAAVGFSKFQLSYDPLGLLEWLVD